jgi:hypothetical protein
MAYETINPSTGVLLASFTVVLPQVFTVRTAAERD